MTDHTFPAPLHTEKYPNYGFFEWLKNNTALYISQIVAILSLILYFATFIYYVSNHGNHESTTTVEEYLEEAKKIIVLLNIIICSVFVISSLYMMGHSKVGQYHAKLFRHAVFNLPLPKIESSTELEKSKTYVRIFKILFAWFWVYVLVFYIYSNLEKSLITELIITKRQSTLINNCLLSLMMVFGIWKYSIILLAEKENSDCKPSNLNLCLSYLPALFIAVLINLLLFNIETIIDLIGKSISIIEISMLSKAVIGIANMIAFSLLISKLDSKLIGLPSWLIAILFGYAAIQLSDISTAGESLADKMIATTDYLLALIFKIYYFLILAYAMQTGRLLNYFYNNAIFKKIIKEGK
jgi:hypothetical protein